MEKAKCGCPTDGEFIFHNRYCDKKIDCCEKVCPSCAKWSVTANDQAQTIEALRAEVEQWKCAAEEDAQFLREAEERRTLNRYGGKPRMILYTDTINGEQASVDNLWAVTTEELNELVALLARVAVLEGAVEWALHEGCAIAQNKGWDAYEKELRRKAKEGE